MSVEAAGAWGIGKWLVGLVLAPWLWHERKRVDKLNDKLNEKLNDYYNKQEVREVIEDKTNNLREDITEIKETLKIISETSVVTSVTLARIDERSKNAEK